MPPYITVYLYISQKAAEKVNQNLLPIDKFLF